MKNDLSEIVLALGSNIGNRENNLADALNYIKNYLNEPIAMSKIYESLPVDFLNQPSFLNLVVAYQVQKNFNPLELLEITQNIEGKIGRNKTIPKGPRKIDIDILFINDLKYDDDRLTIPHPEIYNRDFVYYPLLEIKHCTTKIHLESKIIPPENRLKNLKMCP